MGEWSADWFSGDGGGSLDPEAMDTSPAGAGGDPYGADDGSFDASEAASTGALPGGSENQFTPFSPNGGFDFTDILQGAPSSSLAKSLVGPGGLLYDNSTPNLGTSPAVKLRSQAGGAGTADIVRFVRQSTGLRVTAKSIVGLIVRYGFAGAAALTKLQLPQLLQLFMREKGVRHHKRGPGLYTVARRLAAADRLRATVSRVLGRGHHTRHRRHRRPPFHHMRKRKR